MKKILVPTDFSQQAYHAMEVAVQLAKKYDAELYLVHMLELPPHFALDSGGSLPEGMFYMKLAQGKFETLMEDPILKGVKAYDKVNKFATFSGIMESVKDLDIDMVVMGSHGASGVSEMFIGSNTEKVVRNSEVPVLVIKEHYDVFNVENFVFACDCKENSKKAFRNAAKLAKDIDAHMHLVFINTSNKFLTTREANDRMQAFIHGEDIPKHTLFIYNDLTVEKGIVNYARDINAKLIGMGTHGRKGLARFLDGSISEDIVNHADIPVVTFRI